MSKTLWKPWLIVILLVGTSSTLLGQETTSDLKTTAEPILGEYEIYIQGQYYDLTIDMKEDGLVMVSSVLGNRDLKVEDLNNLQFSFTDQDGVNRMDFLRKTDGQVNSFTLSWEPDGRYEGGRIPKDRKFKDTFSKQELMEDLSQLEGFMQMHPQLYEYTSQEKFSRCWEEARSQVHEDMTVADFYRETAPLVAAIGCYHTRLYVPRHFWPDQGNCLLPMRLEVVGDRVYVREILAESDRVQPGSELVSIEGLPINEIVEELTRYISSDGFITSSKEAYLEAFFPRYYGLVYGMKSSFEIEFVQHGSKQQKVTLEAVSEEKLGELLATAEDPLELITQAEDNLAIMRIDHFGFYQNKSEFTDFVDESFAAIAQQGIDNLILDIRGNGGGDPYAARYLLKYLAQEPIVYFHNPPEPLAETGKPLALASNNHFKGRVYTMLDGGEGSTTGHLLALLKYHGLGEFVGVESGATYFCNDASARFTLKNTRLGLKIARASFAVEVTGMPKNRGILPDYRVEPTSRDLAEKRDTTLEFTRRLIAGN
jgi:hypothetical protein